MSLDIHVVDRDLVAAAVDDAVRTLGEGVGGSVYLEGPPGIGKTHLVSTALERAEPPPVLLRAVGDHRRRNVAFSAVAGLVDGHTHVADDLFARVDQWCAGGPVALWLDDAHHADSASLTVLRRLVWASRDLPLLVVVTGRPSPGREQLTMLRRQMAVHLTVPPLDHEAVARAVEETTGRRPGRRLRRALDAAAGNPLFVVETLRALRDQDLLVEIDDDQVDARSTRWVPRDDLVELVAEHLTQLDDSTREVMAALAAFGYPTPVDDLAEVLFSTPEAVLPSLRHAEQAGLARRDPAGRADFVHDLHRETLYASLPAATRAGLHRGIAQQLQRTGGDAALTAEHLLQAAADRSRASSSGAGPSDPEVLAALRRAVAESSAAAPEVAVDLMDDAAQVIGATDADDHAMLERLHHLFLGGRVESAEAFIRDRIRSVADRRTAGAMQTLLIRSLVNRAATAPALGAIDATLAIAGLPDQVRRELRALRCWVALLAGTPAPAAEVAAVLADAEAAADVPTRAALLTTIACTTYLEGDSTAALAVMDRRAALPVPADSSPMVSTAVVWPAVFRLATEGPPAALAAVEQARRESYRDGREWVGPFLASTAGGASMWAGRWTEATAEMDAALEQAEETGTGWISIVVGNRSYIDAHQGRTAAARTRLEAWRHRGLPVQFGLDHPALAELAVLEAEGATRGALALARTMWRATDRAPFRWRVDAAVDLTRVALAAGDSRLADEIAAGLAEHRVPSDLASVAALVQGMVAGDPALLNRVVTASAAQGRMLLTAFAEEELAVAAAARGDRSQAANGLDRALDGYDRMGATADRARARGRLRTLGLRRGARVPHRDAQTGWDALTPTERRIAALVQEGLTNPQIGARLYVSARTVQTHVSHILTKTGLRSRVEIAASLGSAQATDLDRPAT